MAPASGRETISWGLVSPTDRYVGPCLEEGLRYSPAHSPGAPGDEHRLPLEVERVAQVDRSLHGVCITRTVLSRSTVACHAAMLTRCGQLMGRQETAMLWPMGISSGTLAAGVAEVVIDVPPVNALDVASWFALAECVSACGRDPATRVVILRAEGRGFCAGVDIKEITAGGDEALVGANRGCEAAFAAVYDCEVPVVAAVHGFCLGGGIGLVGNADVIIASEDATFGLPEVDRGALGAATHLARLVPGHRMRSMVYSAEAATASELHSYGSVLEVVPKDELLEKARGFAAKLAEKSPTILRRAKESLNGIDPVDPKRSYRFEQGFTYELHVRGVAAEQREAFVEKRQADTSR